MPEKQHDLIDYIAREPVLAAKLRAIAAGDELTLPSVVEHAHPTLCSVIARLAKRRVWFVCQNVRAQEALHNELIHWHPEALFFPELEVAPIEGALPDPEAVAERLSVVQKLAAAPIKKAAPLILVLTRASLADEVVDESELRKLELQLVRGRKTDREDLLRKLAAAGYEQVAQVTARGQFAIRGGIVDVFSFHHSLPIRLEWFDVELESIRQFEVDSQVSVEQLPACSAKRKRSAKGSRTTFTTMTSPWISTATGPTRGSTSRAARRRNPIRTARHSSSAQRSLITGSANLRLAISW